jgi:hypothetical protein
MRRFLAAAAVAALALSSLVIGPGGPAAEASSHREAPGTSADPAVDATDVYAFVDPEDTTRVNLIMNFIPFQLPQGGPNFFKFDDNVVYAMRIDNNGDAVTDIQVQFRFKTVVRNENTFLYNTGQVTNITDPDLNVIQYYSISLVTGNAPNTTTATFRPFIAVEGAPEGFPFVVAAANIGPRSTPNYEANIGARAVRGGCVSGTCGRFFAGPRDEGFYVDLGSAFDLLGLRPFNSAHLLPRDPAPGVDGTAGLNVHSIAMQLPISMLTANRQTPTSPSDPNAVISLYSAASRPAMTVLAEDRSGTATTSGNLVQVSRLGNPLINEVIIPRGMKDRFNASLPGTDAQFLNFVLKPEPARLIGSGAPVGPGGAKLDAYPTVNTPPEPRNDIATIFLTGIPGVNVQTNTSSNPSVNAFAGQPADTVPQERLRINLAIPPTPGTASEIGTANRLGVLGGDNGGFPNGRRVGDDVVDIELRALAGATPLTPAFNIAPNNQLGDGVNTNDRPFLTRFPYLAPPWAGYDSPTVNDSRGVGSTDTVTPNPTPRPQPTPRP